MNLQPIQVKYGAPTFDPGFQTLYGVPVTRSPIYLVISIVLNPITLVISFVIGTILYLLTQKKLFLIIPIILATLSLIRYLIGVFFGIFI